MKLLAPTLAVLVGADLSLASSIRGHQSERRLTTVTANDDPYVIIQGTRLEDKSPGILRNDLSTGGDLEVTGSTELAGFTGKLKVDKNGKVRYEPPNDDFVGTVRFSYTACQEVDNTVCDTAIVTIDVKRDPNKPTTNPVAYDNTYTVHEGQRLEVRAPGFLNDDRSGTPFNPLFRCEREGRTEGDLDTHRDGSFEYEAPKCWTGTDSFTYRACYEDYEDMESNEATVRIQVTRSPARPDRPRPDNDRYEVYEGETLDIGESRGLLWNDVGGSTLFVNDYDEHSGFVGDLDVDSDGSFSYESISGEKGEFRFDYEVCHDDWECVGCATATVTIDVRTNPRKPTSPPNPSDPNLDIDAGEVLNGRLSDFVKSDSRYTLRFSNFDEADGFGGTLNTESDGDFTYGNAPVGVDTFTYEVCYEEWADLCATGTVTITTNAIAGTDTSSRIGVATFYQVHWAGQGQAGCAAIQPKLSLTCGAEGEIGIIAAGPSDNTSCQKVGNIISCAAKNAGIVHVECRDTSSSNNPRRQLIATLSSDAVACGTTGGFAPYGTYHYTWIDTWCSGAWTDGGVTCSGIALDDPNGPDRCFANAMTLGSSAKPADITMTSNNFEQCANGAGSTVPMGEPPTLERVGDADGEAGVPGYPLKECQADCDSDDECAEGLICMQRRGSEIVPGCIGASSQFDGLDFCIRPQTTNVARAAPGALP